jgi:hypothetical protein
MLKIRHWAQSRGDFNATKAAPLMWNACPKAAVGWVHGELVTLKKSVRSTVMEYLHI